MDIEIKRDDIERLLDFEDEDVKGFYRSWDKGDCSVVGLIEILLFQEIKKHKASNGPYYDQDYDQIILRYRK